MEEKWVIVPGLRKTTGLWGACVGILNPKVMVDPLAEMEPGGNALVIHESVHCVERHALVGLLVLAFSLGTLYPAYRARCEARADATALKLCGVKSFTAFVNMHKHPEDKWGMRLYTKTSWERMARAIRWQKKLG